MVFFKKIAQDLLALEINTIIKADMSAVKMPHSRRQVLYDIAKSYHKKLLDLGFRKPVYWKFAGRRSFGELRDRAREGMEACENRLKTTSIEKQNDIQEEIKILERIQDQSIMIVSMFHDLKNRIKGNDESTKGYKTVPEPIKREEIREDEFGASHENSEIWNNDIDRYRMNVIEDLDLTTEQVTLLRKAWEVGTERIVLQTVIQIDGDVTTRIAERFLENPDKNVVLKIHNDSITTSTSFWTNLMKAMGEIAGKAFGGLLGR
ncbi:MAG: hypothetical protein K8F52_05430 [Candidatus Scalindua rubra]|nr:hypothetical protein [Candidatus Scalindua rubra]